jgi:hypothetical protein
MGNRRWEALSRTIVGVALLALLTASLSNCSSDSARTFTSSSDLGHTHTVTLTQKQIEDTNTPITEDTSLSDNHIHTFHLSSSQMFMITNGETVTCYTGYSIGSSLDPHNHSFTISKWW